MDIATRILYTNVPEFPIAAPTPTLMSSPLQYGGLCGRTTAARRLGHVRYRVESLRDKYVNDLEKIGKRHG